LLLITSFASGSLAMWAVIAIGLFNSIMFPTIFTLAINGLGVHTSQGSSLLVMAIVGGAIVPPLQGVVADFSGNLQLSFLVPLVCYLYIMYYGFIGSKPKEDLA
ncbi:MAG: MFS transporter, partial [Pontibacter sp.]|nr:MFS transporter [Pontibacter sp.]